LTRIPPSLHSAALSLGDRREIGPGFGGCEVLAILNLVTARRDQIGCILFTPIDRAEARRAARRDESLGALRWMP
jgi:hypothetical protein